MNRRNLIIVVVIAGALGAGITGFVVSRFEPTYAGRSLSAWLDEMDAGRRSFDKTRTEKAEAAIRHIGSKAVPWLLDMIRFQDPPNKKQVSWWPIEVLFKSQPQPSPSTIRERGLRGIQILGPEGKAAVTDLINVIRRDNSSEYMFAAGALIRMGLDAKPAVPFLIENLDRTNSLVRFGAYRTMAALGPVASDAVPALGKKLNDPDETVREVAAATLSLIQRSPETVPLLVRQLQGTNLQVRVLAIVYLSVLKTNAVAVVPALTVALSDSNRAVSMLAKSALEKIAPDLATPPTN